MQGHTRSDSRFNDAPSYTHLRQHARKHSRGHSRSHSRSASISQQIFPAGPLTSNRVNLPSNLPRPPSIGSHPIQDRQKKTSTSSRISVRSGNVRSSRRGSLQASQMKGKGGLGSSTPVEVWNEFGQRQVGSENSYGVYMAPAMGSVSVGSLPSTNLTQPFRAAGFVPVATQPTVLERPDSPEGISTSRTPRPTLVSLPSNTNTESRLSRFEDAMDSARPSLDLDYQLEQEIHSARSAGFGSEMESGFRVSRFEDAQDPDEVSLSREPSLDRSESLDYGQPRRSSSIGRSSMETREMGSLANGMFDTRGMEQIQEKDEGNGSQAAKKVLLGAPLKATGSINRSMGSQRRPFSTAPLNDSKQKTKGDAGGWSFANSAPASRRGSVQSESKLDQDIGEKENVLSDRASVKTTNTFGGTSTYTRTYGGKDDAQSVIPSPVTGTFSRGSNTGSTVGFPVGTGETSEAFASGRNKSRRSLIGVFSRGPGSIRSISGSMATGKTGGSMASKYALMPKDEAADRPQVRRAKGSWVSSQTFGHDFMSKYGSPMGRKSEEQLRSKPMGAEVVTSVRDAFPVVRESIELDAARGLMPAGELGRKRNRSSNDLSTSVGRPGSKLVKELPLPASAYSRGMTPEPFLEYRQPAKKTSASPMIVKMKSAFQLNGHQPAHSVDSSVMVEEMLADIATPKPVSGLAKMKSNLSLARFKSHKASLADIEANAKAQEANAKAQEANTRAQAAYAKAHAAAKPAYNSSIPVDNSPGNRSSTSEWTLASVSTVSEGLKAPWEQNGEQEGGIVKKKRSHAAGMLLGKVFKKRDEKRKEKRESKGSFNLKNAASQLTLRPNANRKPSDGRSSVASRRSSIGSRDRASSFANTKRFTFGYSTEPASIMDEVRPSIDHSLAERVKDPSPQLPNFHFARPSYAESGLNIQLDDNGQSFVSRFGYGVPENREEGLATETESNPPNTATTAFEFSIHSRSSQDEQVYPRPDSRISHQEEPEQGDCSLDRIEDDLDYMRARMSFLEASQGRRRHSSGFMPKRQGLKGLFDAPPAAQMSSVDSVLLPRSQLDTVREALREVETDALQIPRVKSQKSLPKLPQDGQVMDLQQVSDKTNDLHSLVANFPGSTPSSTTTPTPSKQVMMASPSVSEYLESDSPTPLSRHSSGQTAHRASMYVANRPRTSPVRVSPLRLAINNSLTKKYGSSASPMTTQSQASAPGKVAIGEQSSGSAGAYHQKSVASADLSDDLAHNNILQTMVTEPTPRNQTTAEIVESRENLPRLDVNSNQAVAKGSVASTVSTLSPSDDDVHRSSFDFTGEYAQLNENGSRMSFLEELDKFGIADALPATRPPSGEEKTLEHKASDATITKRCSLNREFKFGMPYPPEEPAQNVTASSGGSGIVFQPRESNHITDESVFSIASISSLGRIVDTGIGGNFVNVFERDFLSGLRKSGSTMDARFACGSKLRPSASVSSFASSSGLTDEAVDRRQRSSVESALSAVRRIGRPGVDSDRMFQTNGLYSIQASPTGSRRSSDSPLNGQARLKPAQSYDTILDGPASLYSVDSLADSSVSKASRVLDDSIFSSGNRSDSFALFGAQRIPEPRDNGGSDLSTSPLASKNGDRMGMSVDLEKRPPPGTASKLSRGLDLKFDPSFPAGSIFAPIDPRKAGSRGHALRSPFSAITLPAEIHTYDRPLTDVLPVTSTKVDRGAVPQSHAAFSIHRAQLSSLSSVDPANQPNIMEEVDNRISPDNCDKRDTQDSIVSKYLSGDREQASSEWQNMLPRSRGTRDFTIPTNDDEAHQFLAMSRLLNTSLAEASPRTQLARREQYEAMQADKAPVYSRMSVDSQRSALPTKFQRSDSANTALSGIASRSGSTTPSMILQFGGGKLSTTPSMLLESTAGSPSPMKARISHDKAERRNSPSKRQSRVVSNSRPRVVSTASARRAKLGWGRRRDTVEEVPPVLSPSPRPTSRKSVISTASEKSVVDGAIGAVGAV